MAHEQYVTVEPLGDRREELTEVWNAVGYPIFGDELVDSKVANVLLRLQVDATRAMEIFHGIIKQLQQSPEEGNQLIQDLATCARNAYKATSYSASEIEYVDSEEVMMNVHLFLSNELGYKPPKLPANKPSLRSRAHARKLARGRYSSSHEGDKWSGGLCPFTRTPHAVRGPISPVKPARGNTGNLWFWLWMAIILPQATYDAAWRVAGKAEHHSLANVITMCDQLAHDFVNLNICFKPIIEDPTAVSFKMELQHRPDQNIRMFKLWRGDDDALIRNGTQFLWQPCDGSTQEDAPSPILLSLHRYMVVCAHEFEALEDYAERNPVTAARQPVLSPPFIVPVRDEECSCAIDRHEVNDVKWDPYGMYNPLDRYEVDDFKWDPYGMYNPLDRYEVDDFKWDPRGMYNPLDLER